MPARLSVVIPTLNAAEAFETCLPPLMEGLEAGLIRELVVSDGGSTDATHTIAQEVGAQLITGPASRGGQLQRGVDVASGDWLLMLHADSRLPRGWTAPVAAQIEAGSPAYFRLKFDDSSLGAAWVAGWANLRSRLFGLPYGDQGLLISRRDYDAVGGYPDSPLMEDVSIVRRLRGRLVMLPLSMTTSAARYRRDGWLRRGARNLSLLARYFAGVDPDRLARRY